MQYVDCSIRRPGSIQAVIDGIDVCACPVGMSHAGFLLPPPPIIVSHFEGTGIEMMTTYDDRYHMSSWGDRCSPCSGTRDYKYLASPTISVVCWCFLQQLHPVCYNCIFVVNKRTNLLRCLKASCGHFDCIDSLYHVPCLFCPSSGKREEKGVIYAGDDVVGRHENNNTMSQGLLKNLVFGIFWSSW